MDESGLIHVTRELCPVLGKLLLVLVVALEFSHPDEVPHLGIVIHITESDLLAFISQEGLFVPELQGIGEGNLICTLSYNCLIN